MTDMLLTQTVTAVYRVRYDRAQAIEMLTALAGEDPGVLALCTDAELAEKIVAAANVADANEIYDRLCGDSDGPEPMLDTLGDWEATEVYGDSALHRQLECRVGGHDYRGDVCYRCGTRRQRVGNAYRYTFPEGYFR